MASLEPIASLLDKAHNSDTYSEVLTAMEARLEDASSTPAAILLREMADNNETYYGFAMRKAREQRDHFLQWPPTKETADKYRDLAQQSIWQQTEIESNDKLPFGEFLANYR
jgi:glutamate--cysteine ligase